MGVNSTKKQLLENNSLSETTMKTPDDNTTTAQELRTQKRTKRHIPFMR